NIGLIEAQNSLGDLLTTTGRAEEALRNYHEVLPVAEKLVDDFPHAVHGVGRLWELRFCLSEALFAAGRMPEAQDAAARAVTIMEKRYAEPPSVQTSQNLGVTYYHQGCLFSLARRPQDACDAFRRALEMLEKRAAARPNDRSNTRLARLLAG